MKLNHLDLQVADVPRSVGLFENLLGFHLESNRASPALAILTDGHGFTLVLQRRKNDTDAYQDSFHFGFLVDDVAAVRAFHLKAREGGLVTVSDVLENGRGVLVYCRTSDGLLFEVSCPRARSQGDTASKLGLLLSLSIVLAMGARGSFCINTRPRRND
jgi:catechol 2,3-dioxygenase-like lactoylglutathione lyase family enzyme